MAIPQELLCLTDDQSEVFRAIIDTIVAPLTDQEESELLANLADIAIHTKDQITTFAKLPALHGEIFDFLYHATPPDQQKVFATLLSLLANPHSALLLTGHWSRFDQLTRQQREAVVNNWRTSNFAFKRLIYKVIYFIVTYPLYRKVGTEFQACIGYSGKDHVRNQPDYQPKRQHPRLPMMTTEEALAEPLKFDIIVIGSGCGGGVCAGRLAQAGKSVLVIEKGKYYHHSEYDLQETTGFDDLYENRGLLTTGDGSVLVFAGSTFGGGSAFADDLEEVCHRIGATTAGIEHNVPNQILAKGCRKLGYPLSAIPQNTSGHQHECEFCGCGCKDGIKNTTTHTWLRDAHEHGARFLDQTRVVRILTRNKKAIGIECIVHGQHTVTIAANQVVVSAGTLHSPNLLIRSGLKNKHLGQHLRLHPCHVVVGFFSETVDMFRGPILTNVSNVAENWNGDNYGVKIEAPTVLGGGFSGLLPWRGAAHHKEIMLRYRQCSPLVIVARDKDSQGSVSYDDQGNLKVNYKLSKHDTQSLIEGMIHALKILCAGGAAELQTTQFGLEPFRFSKTEKPDVNNPRFVQWLQQVRAYGLPAHGCNVMSAHQMGTCRMGVSPSVSATKPTGETWEVENLYVADASLLPTACGVNPMITIQATALHVANTMIAAYGNQKSSTEQNPEM
ncbi:uncharacterized protein BYT42DRAFT_526121 [Radiomyces spectabilis]|uniref:uncharacterized protein n=1 Tax=Radiomyces spectabilis TaxID=64574 RepID=UPI0022207B14|nr:uncharacterized protein BYT42DRAFT_526121 [Radiomyces spectabilis]KAI8390932.1 hypothetical protein BYT42DRAFT_526121 [Radiomyces spectabilis]